MNITVGAMLRIPKRDVTDARKLQTAYTYITKNDTWVSTFNLDKQYYYLPRNINKLSETLGTTNFNITYETVKDCFIQAKVKESFSLKEAQQIALDKLLPVLDTNFSAILQAPCGFGKSYTLGYVIQHIKQRTLILVDRTTLVEQMYEELTHNLDASITVLNATNRELKDVNICTIQFLLRNEEFVKEICGKIGFVVVDECHITPASTFLTLVQQFPAHYRLGLSATPTRSDGLTSVLYDVFTSNKILGEVVKKEFIAYGVVPTHTVPLNYDKFLPSVTAFYGSSNVVRGIVAICNKAKSTNRVTFVASDNKANQQLYKDKLKEEGLTAEIVNSETKSSERLEIFERVDKGLVDVLIGFGVLEKGVSIRRLDTLVIAVSAISKEKLEQVIGRLLREHDDAKSPIIFDLTYGTRGNTFKTKKSWYESQKECKLKWISGYDSLVNSLNKKD